MSSRFRTPRVRSLVSLVAIWLGAHAVPAFAAPSTSDATVFIRIIGEIRFTPADRDRLPAEALKLGEVEIGTGTGFVISPVGYVMTNRHVVAVGELTIPDRSGRPVQVGIDVRRIEVIFPPAAGDAEPRRLTATVAASDAALDLAVLYVGGTDLPYAPLGDSDALQAGQPITVMGYPLGRVVEVGRASGQDLAPQATMTSGGVSALRSSDAGDLRYIQTDAAVNPGNSGGPLVDRDGYVQGMIQSRLTGASGIGFAIPINLVKRFLVMNGLDQTLPVRLLALGPLYAPDAKRLRLRLPVGFEDISPSRLQVASAEGSATVALRIDRVPSLWSLEQLEQALVQGNVFERFAGTPRSAQVRTSFGKRRVREGSAIGFAAGDDTELKMEYALVDLPREKVVARYVGPAEQLAANRSVLLASLASLDVEPLLTSEINQRTVAAWQPVALALPDAPRLSIPSDWIVAPGGPTGCALRRPADLTFAVSPVRDYSVSFRFAWWRGSTVASADGASTCGSSPGSGKPTYASRADWLGLGYVVEGVFVPMNDKSVAQLEVIAPVEKIGFVRGLFADWVKTLTLP